MTPYTIIDADAHMCEPPTLWLERLDQRFRDRAPRVVKDPDGKKGSFFICEGGLQMRVAGVFATGKVFDKACMELGMEDAVPGGWDPAARLKDMPLDGVEAAVLYTTFGFGLFRLEDGALQAACFRAYNDWLAEFCSYAPERFAGLALISLFDVEQGRQELERCRKKGLKGALIWASPPEERPYSLPLYDPLWATAQELEMPLSLHLATGRRKESKIDESNLTEFWVNLVARPHEIQHSLLTLIFGGVLERFPRLKVVSAENDIAWTPHLLERADKYYRRLRKGYDTPLSLKPSEYSRRQLYYTFIDDPMGLQTYQLTGSADNFMWSTDYPHQAATWPRSQEVVAQAFAGIPQEAKRKMVQENTRKLYGFALG